MRPVRPCSAPDSGHIGRQGSGAPRHPYQTPGQGSWDRSLRARTTNLPTRCGPVDSGANSRSAQVLDEAAQGPPRWRSPLGKGPGTPGFGTRQPSVLGDHDEDSQQLGSDGRPRHRVAASSLLALSALSVGVGSTLAAGGSGSIWTTERRLRRAPAQNQNLYAVGRDDLRPRRELRCVDAAQLVDRGHARRRQRRSRSGRRVRRGHDRRRRGVLPRPVRGRAR